MAPDAALRNIVLAHAVPVGRPQDPFGEFICA